MTRFRRTLMTLSIAAGLAAGSAGVLHAQEPPAPKDDGLDSLLEKVSAPSDPAAGESAKSTTGKKDGPAAKPGSGDKSARPDGGVEKPGMPGSGPAGAKAAKDDDPKAKPKKGEGDAPLSGNDQEVDDLLKKLGETTDAPSPEDRPRGGGAGGQKPDSGPSSKKPGQPPDPSKLSGKDKETDEHLEELTGRKRRKKNDDGERTGPAGELIKEMREIEQKLEKPDTGETTRDQQKKVVKRIDTLIEEAKRSGQSSLGRIVTRRVRRPGQQPGGQQPGSPEGTMARGAPLQKPLKPTTKHANVGGKNEWGHLPDELRQEIENQTNELPLTTKRELIDRYYLSVGKGKLVREDSP